MRKRMSGKKVGVYVYLDPEDFEELSRSAKKLE